MVAIMFALFMSENIYLYNENWVEILATREKFPDSYFAYHSEIMNHRTSRVHWILTNTGGE